MINNKVHVNIPSIVTTYLKNDTIEELGIRYKVTYDSDSLGKKFTRDKLYCLVKDGYVYINNQRFHLPAVGFKKILSESDHYYRVVVSYYTGSTSIAVGWALGGVIGASIAYKLAANTDGNYIREPGLIDKKTGKFYELDEKGVVYLLFNDHHDLYLEFREMKNRGDINGIWKLIDRYEERLR